MRISDWSSDVCSSDLLRAANKDLSFRPLAQQRSRRFVDDPHFIVDDAPVRGRAKLKLFDAPDTQRDRWRLAASEGARYGAPRDRLRRPAHKLDRKSTRLNSSH